MLPAPAREVVDHLLRRLDRAVPGHIDGFYVVGSACLGAFRAGRSDLDFVAIVSGGLGRHELARVGRCTWVGGARRWSATGRRGAVGRWLATAFTAAGTAKQRREPTRAPPTLGCRRAPRLHYTIATGAIISKPAAARYALETFDARWHAVISDALGFWRGEPAPEPYRRHPARRNRDAGRFVDAVIEAAHRL